MKILMLVPFLPNTSMSGGQTRWYNLIKHLSIDHEITLYSLIKDDSEKKIIPELEKYCKKIRVFKRSKNPWTASNILRSVLGKYPFLVVRNLPPKVKQALREELKENDFDLIHAETFYVMPHIPRTNIPSIMVEQTIEYQVYKHYVDTKIPFFLRPFFMIDVMKLKYWEKHYWEKTDRLVAVSEEDKKIMQELIPGIEADVVPNGVDTDYYKSKNVKRKTPPRVLYGVTNFEWLQNVEAVDILIEKVWPLVHEEIPKAKLWIVGRKIPERIIKLSKERNDIEITESIKDARDAYKAATLMITPIRGSGGTRLKILEAMAAELPIVSTSVGVAGLNVKHNKHVLISDSNEGMADEAVKLLKDYKKLNQISKDGFAFVRDNFDWKSVVKLHDPIYARVTNSK